MATFDLDRFRRLAFGGARTLPDHPLQDTADVEKMLAELPAAPEAALAELTLWASTMNATDSFTPGRRARVLMALDGPARPLWRELARRYLAPDGRPSERRDGDADILRALFDAASQIADGFGLVLDAAAAHDSDWVKENRAKLYVRNIRWLGRRLALSHMLNLNSVGAIWERVHRLHARAEEEGLARQILAPFEGDKATTSVRQEYARMLVFELASPDSMRGRDVELAFRIAGRAAPAVRLEAKATDETPFAVLPDGDARPGPLASLAGRKKLLYIATLPCLPRLRAMQERDLGRDPAEPDTLFGTEYTLRERNALMERIIEHWSADAPRRRSRRVALASEARVVSGFEAIAALIPAAEKGPLPSAKRDLQLSIDNTTLTLSRAKLRAAQKVGPARVVDASNGGLGLALVPREARWARHGLPVAIQIAPSTDWIVGVLRRIFSVGEEVRLGIQVLSREPRALSVNPPEALGTTAWEDAVKFEATFKERYRKTLLLQPQALPLQGAEMLLPAGLVRAGTELDVPQGGTTQRIRVTRLLEDGEHYQRALFEPAR
ncbi:MAG TPA: hypothetical protein VG873_15110 [Burkholderiales bacterium]|nr:hypothetical protein [Burkholderiales bacterium]